MGANRNVFAHLLRIFGIPHPYPIHHWTSPHWLYKSQCCFIFRAMGIKALPSVAEIPNVEHCAKPLVKLCIHGCAQEKTPLGWSQKLGIPGIPPQFIAILVGNFRF